MLFSKKYFSVLALAGFFTCFTAMAQQPPTLHDSKLPIVSLSVQGSSFAANDKVLATVFVEADGATLAGLSKRVNSLIAETLKLSKPYSVVKTQTGNTSTSPNYGKTGKIESWQMRSEIILQSNDVVAVSELLGKLQNIVGISQILIQPSPETRKKAEATATLAAIAAFQERAQLIAEALGKTYTIKYLSTDTNTRYPQHEPEFAASDLQRSRVAKMPLEAGDSQVIVNLSGMIELK